MKKTLLVGLLLSVLVIPSISFAQSAEDIQAKIAELTKLIQQLQAQLQTLQSGSAQWCHTFNTNLRIGDFNSEVSTLKNALAKEGFNIDQSMKFDEETAANVSGFQEKYQTEILAPFRLQRGTGYVGPSTRAKLNKLYGCGNVNTQVPPQVSNIIPTVSLAANPTSIISDGKPGTIILSWSSKNATSCLFEKQTLSPSGSMSVSLSQTTTYTISCTGPGGTATSYPVTIPFQLTGQTPPTAPTVTLSANPTSIISDGKPGTITLYWSSANAVACQFEKALLPTSGSKQVSLSQTATYTISCTGAGGSTTSNPVTVTFQLTGQSTTPPTVTLSASPTSIISDGKPGTVNLSWSSNNATYCNFEKTALSPSGSMAVSLSQTTTYSISCTGPGGTASSNAVTVTFQPSQQLPSADLKVNSSDGPLAKTAGYATFSWTSANADYCTASGDTYWSGTKSTSGSESIWTGNEKTGMTIYSITCGASSGKVSPASDSVTVTFLQPPTVDLKINNSDGPLTKFAGYSTFSWISTNADYCTASGDTYWSGSKSTSGSESVWTGNEKTGVTTYQITCGASSGKTNPASDTVTVSFQ